MEEEDEAAAAYAVWLKALQEDADLFTRLKDFVHNLIAFKKNKRARQRVLQEPTAEFYRSSVYFSPEQASALLSFKRGDGLMLEQALQSTVACKLQQACGIGSTLYYELCTAHVLAPVFQDHFGLRG